ncbi:MAG: BamA/TamA family outer membrane protein [Zoogloeaceae bacterium]|jgi:translocation and assembly module TamA|nr:BamA/TamA family outer membrane protein [Zoogloeaceae bacterium]
MRRALFLLLLLCSASAGGAPPEIVAPPPLDALLQRYLPLEMPDANDPDARAAFAERIDREGRALLATEGYFNVRLQLTENFVIQVEPGARALVEQVDISIDGPVPEARKAALREAWTLKAGAPFRQADWTAAKEGLLMALMERDFPGARLLDSQAEVDADQNRVRIRLHYASGAAYRFGALEIEGLARYSPELIARYNTQVKAGDPYDENRLAALQNTLENTPYFASVSVRLNTDAGENREAGDIIIAPVQVQLREQAPHRLNLGAGVSSNTGARVEVNFRTADLFSRAWQLNSGVRLEELKQSAYADIFFPPTPEDYHYALGVQVERSDIRNLELRTESLGLSRSHRQGSVENVLTLSYITEREISDALPQSRNRALTLNSMWTWTPKVASDAFWFNHVSQIQVGGAIRPISDQNFVRLYGATLHNFRLNARNTLSLRAEGGIVLVDSREGIPQNFLFRAGGTQSVRGYAYQSLGVREGSTTLGGRYLLTASGELTHWLADSPWGVAAFVDVGNAGDDKKTFQLQRGYGVGARWRSEAGAIGVDVAYGKNWHLHFSLSLPF